MENDDVKDPVEAVANALGRALIERGMIVAAGYEAYKLMFRPQLEAAERRAFIAGAQHLFASIMNSALDGGTEETDGDMRRMHAIAAELKEFEQTVLRPASGH